MQSELDAALTCKVELKVAGDGREGRDGGYPEEWPSVSPSVERSDRLSYCPGFDCN